MKYKVIVADDEDVIRKGIVYLIDWDKLNCEIVQECTDGLQVLKYLEKNTADIVITDIKMPKLSGIELMEEIDKKHKGLMGIKNNTQDTWKCTLPNGEIKEVEPGKTRALGKGMTIDFGKSIIAKL